MIEFLRFKILRVEFALRPSLLETPLSDLWPSDRPTKIGVDLGGALQRQRPCLVKSVHVSRKKNLVCMEY